MSASVRPQCVGPVDAPSLSFSESCASVRPPFRGDAHADALKRSPDTQPKRIIYENQTTHTDAHR
jgi:hypothetical protein